MSAKAAGKGSFLPPQDTPKINFKTLDPLLVYLSAAIGLFIDEGDADSVKATLLHMRLIEAIAFERLEAQGLDTSTLKKNIEKVVDSHLNNQYKGN